MVEIDLPSHELIARWLVEPPQQVLASPDERRILAIDSRPMELDIRMD